MIEHSEPSQPTVRMWRVRILTTTWLSYAGFYFCRKNFAIAKSSIMSSMEIGRSDVAHLFTAYLAAYMLGQFLTGFLGRRVATRMLLLAGMGMTLLDSLDVLWIMGMKEEFQRARDWVVDNLSFAKPRSVSFFETTIRALGGLLSAYELSKDKVFLDKAQDLGDRLLHAFKTPSGIPHGQVHLTSGRSSNPGWTGSVRYFLPGRDLVLATHVY